VTASGSLLLHVSDIGFDERRTARALIPHMFFQEDRVAINYRKFLSILALLFIDVSAFYCSLVTAYYARSLLNVIIPNIIALQLSLTFFFNIWWLPVVFLFFFAYERLYIKKLPFWDEARSILLAVTVSSIMVLAILTLGKMSEQVSRLTIVFLWFFGLFIFPLFRFAGQRVLHGIGLWKENVIIIGAGEAGIAAAKGISGEVHLGYNLIGFLDDDEGKIGTELSVDGKSYKVFGKTKNFTKFVRLLNISTIIIALPSLPVAKLAELTNNIQKHTRNILLIPDVKGIALTNTELYHLFAQQLFLLKINNNLKSPFNRFVKRTFDLTVSVLFLPLLLPLIALLGLLIQIDSPGPVFYRHIRIGRGGRPFGVYKFRSMYRDAGERLEKILRTDPEARREWEVFFKLKNDPRITRMGGFLRKTSLDELPQIFNVLTGEMSLVGPRPVLAEEITKYYKGFSDYYHLVRPGITGLWQVSGRNDMDYDKRVRLDAWYVLNWSVWLDLLMLFKTIRVVLKREGAY
jgi:Undecaprenyl-phosphate galactose phosphotransferase WbaP